MSFEIVRMYKEYDSSSSHTEDPYYDSSIHILDEDDDGIEEQLQVDEMVDNEENEEDSSLGKPNQKKTISAPSKLTIFGTIFVILGLITIVLCVVKPETFTFGPQTKKRQKSLSSKNSQEPTNLSNQITKTPTSFTFPETTRPPSPVVVVEEELSSGSPSPTTSPTFEFASLLERLEKFTPRSVLLDATTPQGMGYVFVDRIDEYHPLEYQHDSMVQRWVLASFYFATGGRLTRSTWERCSAVPDSSVTTEVAARSKNHGTKCVDDIDESSPITVCAPREAFLECLVDDGTVTAKRWLSNVTECEWWGVSCNDRQQVVGISLLYNRLDGTLIRELQALGKLETLHLAGNQLMGFLPELELESVVYVNLNDNELVGSIPASWYDWETIQQLRIQRNLLSGMLNMTKAKWSSLVSLSLGENDALELSSSDLSDGPQLMTVTQSLDLSYVRIGDTFPKGMVALNQLRYLDLSFCDLQGPIPSSIGNLTRLEKLHLHDNILTGLIPSSMYGLVNLQSLQLHNNDFSGTLSEAIGNLTGLQVLDLRRSGLSGDIPSSLAQLDYIESLHLEFNKFKGEVPEGLCQVPSRLKDLAADCGKKGTVECTCCSQCCNARREKCSVP